MSPSIDTIVRRVVACKCDRFVDIVKVARLRPDRSFRHVDLSHISFAGQDLCGFDFTGANLLGCDFVGANVDGTIFTDAELDETGQEVVQLALELATPLEYLNPLMPDIYASLVQQSQDFLSAVSALRALETSDHIPTQCFIQVLDLAPNETAALQIFDAWRPDLSLDDFAVIARLCGRIIGAAAAAVAVDRLDRWNIHPHELVTHLGSHEARLSAVARLAEKNMLTDDVLQALRNRATSEGEIDDILDCLRMLSEKGQVELNLARFISTSHSLPRAIHIFRELASWNKSLSHDQSAALLLEQVDTAEQASEVLSIGSDVAQQALFWHAVRRLSVGAIRKLVSLFPVSVPAHRLRDEILLRSTLSVADLVHFMTLSIELGLPQSKQIESALTRVRPDLAPLFDTGTGPISRDTWGHFEVACYNKDEKQAIKDLQSILRGGGLAARRVGRDMASRSSLET